jgi:type III restriction enzyme
VEAVPEKSHFALAWPNVVRVDRIVSHDLELDFEKPRTLVIDARASALLVDLAPIVDGQPDLDAIDQLEVERLARAHRLQQVAFGAVRDMFYQEPGAEWRGNEALLMSRIADIALRFVESGKIQIEPARFGVDPLRRRVLIALNFTRVLRHLWKHFLPRSTARYELIFDHRLPIRTTADMNPWYTSKAAHAARRSHVNYAVRGRGWEGEVANLLDQRTAYVDAWVKSDRLGFEIAYVERGAGAIYRPEYLVRMRNGTMLVLDVNGVADEKNTARRDALAQWIHAVNADGRFGTWATDALRAPEELTALLERHAGTDVR